MLDIEFIYDKSCPNVSTARANLMKAISKSNLKLKWKEWDRNDPSTPGHTKKYGSPTVLINGKDICDHNPEEGNNSCRIYSSDNGNLGVPSVELIFNKIQECKLTQNISNSSRKNILGFMGITSIGPGVGAAILAKASCPLCYPAIAALLSSLGLGVLCEGTYFLILMSFFFLIALFGLGFKAKDRHGYSPFILGIVSCALAFIGQAYSIEALFYIGIISLIAASIWNLVPVKNNDCANCIN